MYKCSLYPRHSRGSHAQDYRLGYIYFCASQFLYLVQYTPFCAFSVWDQHLCRESKHAYPRDVRQFPALNGSCRQCEKIRRPRAHGVYCGMKNSFVGKVRRCRPVVLLWSVPGENCRLTYKREKKKTAGAMSIYTSKVPLSLSRHHVAREPARRSTKNHSVTRSLKLLCCLI